MELALQLTKLDHTSSLGISKQDHSLTKDSKALEKGSVISSQDSTFSESDAKNVRSSKGFTRDQIEQVVEEIQQDLDVMNTKIAFRVDSESEEFVVEVLDRDTGEVLKQIPPEEILNIRTAFKELVRGIFLDTAA